MPGHWWEIKRPGFARVRALDLDGNEVEYAGDGLLGRVLQHEIDHLDQKLLIDRLDRPVRKKALRDLRDEALGLGHIRVSRVAFLGTPGSGFAHLEVPGRKSRRSRCHHPTGSTQRPGAAPHPSLRSRSRQHASD